MVGSLVGLVVVGWELLAKPGFLKVVGLAQLVSLKVVELAQLVFLKVVGLAQLVFLREE